MLVIIRTARRASVSHEQEHRYYYPRCVPSLPAIRPVNVDTSTLWRLLCMYVCIYVFVYVFMSVVCIYVCMQLCMYCVYSCGLHVSMYV